MYTWMTDAEFPQFIPYKRFDSFRFFFIRRQVNRIDDEEHFIEFKCIFTRPIERGTPDLLLQMHGYNR